MMYHGCDYNIINISNIIDFCPVDWDIMPHCIDMFRTTFNMTLIVHITILLFINNVPIKIVINIAICVVENSILSTVCIVVIQSSYRRERKHLLPYT
jgi:hypothetical protein